MSPMSDDLTSKRLCAERGNYATDANLCRRQALFAYAVPSSTTQPKLEDLFEWRPDATVLDIGCGNGLWTSKAAALTSQGMVIGLDNSSGMLAALRNRTRDAIPILGDGHCLPLRSNCLDAVLALWVLYHLRDKTAVFNEVKRTMKPGGRFIAATNSSETLKGVDDLITQSLEMVMGRRVERWIEPLDFTVENGETVMGSFFDEIELVASESEFEVPKPEPLLAYAESLKGPMEAEVGPGLRFDSFLETLRELVEEHLLSGPIRFSHNTGFFVAR